MDRIKTVFFFVAIFIALGSSTAFTEPADAHRASASVFIALPVDKAWTQLQDFSVAHNYVPDLSRTEIVSTIKKGVGAHRQVYDMGGDYIDETIIEWYEGRGFLLRIHQGDKPLAPFTMSQFLYSLQAEGEGTRVILTLIYQMPWGFLGEKLSDWLISGIASSNVANVAAGMKHFYETGLAATDQDRERLLDQVDINL